ncbi:hypothetical protein LTS08_008581 [Lithohypha guttulata]|nr:hypothetical protein LTS08_008581 [Lithohypha guttulata]
MCYKITRSYPFCREYRRIDDTHDNEEYAYCGLAGRKNNAGRTISTAIERRGTRFVSPALCSYCWDQQDDEPSSSLDPYNSSINYRPRSVANEARYSRSTLEESRRRLRSLEEAVDICRSRSTDSIGSSNTSANHSSHDLYWKDCSCSLCQKREAEYEADRKYSEGKVSSWITTSDYPSTTLGTHLECANVAYLKEKGEDDGEWTLVERSSRAESLVSVKSVDTEKWHHSRNKMDRISRLYDEHKERKTKCALASSPAFSQHSDEDSTSSYNKTSARSKGRRQRKDKGKARSKGKGKVSEIKEQTNKIETETEIETDGKSSTRSSSPPVLVEPDQDVL